MTTKAAKQIWLICSGILFILCFNYISVSQGWKASLGLGFLSIDIGLSNRIQATVVGIPIIGFGLIFTTYIGIRHANSHTLKYASWDERVPIKIPGIEPRCQESRILAIFTLLFLTLLPLYSLWHFLRKFHKYGEICDSETNTITGVWEYINGFPYWDNQFSVGSNGESCIGATYEPFIQPLLQLLLVIMATLMVIYFIYKVIVSKKI